MAAKKSWRSSARQVDLGNFFADTFGFEEFCAEGVHKRVNQDIFQKLSLRESNGLTYLKSEANQREFCIGSFNLISLGELEAQCAPLLESAPGEGRVTVFMGCGLQHTINLRLVDVAALQADEENKGATFQVASNFNCLEFTHAGDSPAAGISRYIFDKTQGPAASISCAPATLFRNYLVPHDGVQGQLESQLQMLGSLPEIPIRNGYIVFDHNSLHNISSVDSLPWHLLRVGWQRSTQVTFGLRGAQLEACDRPDQLINQVFCAALNVPGQPKDVQESEVLKEIAKTLLVKQYRATILAAMLHHSQHRDVPGARRLFLTLLGGGAFDNDPAWIGAALRSNAELIRRSGLDVRVVVFDGQLARLAVVRELADQVAATGGAVIHVD